MRGTQGINPIVCVRLAGPTALVFALAGCASSKSAESHADYTAEVQTTRTEGAERVIRVVEVFGQDADQRVNPPAALSTSGAAPAVPTQGQLLRRTTTTIDRAPIITETHSGTDLHTDAESASSHSWFHLGFLAWAGIAAGAVGVGLLAWKFRGGLASGVLRLLGK